MCDKDTIFASQSYFVHSIAYAIAKELNKYG